MLIYVKIIKNFKKILNCMLIYVKKKIFHRTDRRTDGLSTQTIFRNLTINASYFWLPFVWVAVGFHPFFVTFF